MYLALYLVLGGPTDLMGLTEKTDMWTNIMIKCAKSSGDLEISEGTFRSSTQLSLLRPGKTFYKDYV